MNNRTFKKSAVAVLSYLTVLSLGAHAQNNVRVPPPYWAQGVMVKFNELSNLAVGGTNTYQFDSEAGAGYFSNTYTGNVTVSCDSGRLIDCSAPNQPQTPPAPEIDPAAAQDLATQVKCVFLDGGALIASSTYQKSVTTVGFNGLGAWTFTYTYQVSPAVGNVSSLTAWNLISSSGSNGKATVTVNADIASETVIQREVGKVYFFRLREDDGSSRISRLRLRLNGSLIAKPKMTVLSNCPGCAAGEMGAIDFKYQTNSGVIGNASLLTNGDARTLLNTDAARRNDNGGIDGRRLSIGKMSPVTLSLPAGHYSLQLSGRVNATSIVADEDFQVSSQVTVVGMGCSANP